MPSPDTLTQTASDQLSRWWAYFADLRDAPSELFGDVVSVVTPAGTATSLANLASVLEKLPRPVTTTIETITITDRNVFVKTVAVAETEVLRFLFRFAWSTDNKPKIAAIYVSHATS